MGFKQRLKNWPFLYQSILTVLNFTRYFDIQFNRKFPRYRPSPYWQKRIDIVKQSPDNARLHRVADAGRVFADHQLMHNGLQISLGSYYDFGNTVLLQENQGVHEPQEELVFERVIASMPPNAAMMELGSYWAYYSMWFASRVANAQCFMIEPDPHKMNFGKLNFQRNGLKGTFKLGFISDHTNYRSSIPTLHVDELMTNFRINFLHILHSDIQGYELAMLRGAERAIADKKIGYFFISTHSNQLHEDCKTLLREKGYVIVCDANLDESYSVDGLIVAKLPSIPGPDLFEISKRQVAPQGHVVG